MHVTKLLFTTFIVWLMLTVPVGVLASDTELASEVNRDIEQLLRTEGLSIRGVEILTQAILLEVYEDHGFAPYWTSQARIRELMELIGNSADHGLIPSDYNIAKLNEFLQQRIAKPGAEIEAEADILLTASLLR